MTYENYELYKAPPLVMENWQQNWQINWNNVPNTVVSVHTLNEVIAVLEKNNYKPLPPQEKDVRSMNKFRNAFYVRISGRYCSLFWLEHKRNGYDIYCRPHKISTNAALATATETEDIAPSEVKAYIQNYFIKHNFDFNKVYSPILETREKEQIKHCIPAPIGYCQNTVMVRNHCYKADVSSAYPFEASKRLPTYEGRKIVLGISAPTDDFPFAFYPQTGTLAILEEDGTIINTGDFYDTGFYQKEDWKKEGKRRIYNNKRAGYVEHGYREITILCKAANDTLFAQLFKELYEEKNTNPKAKPIMNIFLGTLQENHNPDRAYISAVVLARCCYRMITLAQALEKDESTQVVLIATDSIAWRGKPHPHLWTTEKKLGNFVLEHYDAAMIIRGEKKYQIQDKERVVTKWAGVSKEITADLPFGALINPELLPEKEIFWNETLMRLVDSNNEPY